MVGRGPGRRWRGQQDPRWQTLRGAAQARSASSSLVSSSLEDSWAERQVLAEYQLRLLLGLPWPRPEVGGGTAGGLGPKGLGRSSRPQLTEWGQRPNSGYKHLLEHPIPLGIAMLGGRYA